MKPYVSIDIETTGLNPHNCQILEIGAVIEDWKTSISDLSTFHCYVDHGDPVIGSMYALSMHPKILRRIATEEEGYSYLKPGEVAEKFKEWLLNNGFDPSQRHLTVAGKNFASFDRQFLEMLPHWSALVPMQHRSIDPENLYWDPWLDLEGLPDLKTCMKRAGILGEVVHNAVEDATVVVRLIRHHFA